MCFAGRSNVGKSTLLNAVIDKEGLAATSLLPGETRAITFYCLKEALTLVDLPGYGFAHATEQKRQEWLDLMRMYFADRRQLRHVYILVDAAHGMKAIDRDLVDFLNGHNVQFRSAWLPAPLPLARLKMIRISIAVIMYCCGEEKSKLFAAVPLAPCFRGAECHFRWHLWCPNFWWLWTSVGWEVGGGGDPERYLSAPRGL